MTLAEEINSRLQSLQPTEFYIEDESAMHAGHAGNSGGGHFTVSKPSLVLRHQVNALPLESMTLQHQ